MNLHEKSIQKILQMMEDDVMMHCINTAKTIEKIFDKTGIDPRYKDKLVTAAAIHDVGKIDIAQRILKKPGNLTELERKIIDLHAYIGYKILQSEACDEDICQIVLYHHGEGKTVLEAVPPLKQELKDVALALRTVDAYDALTSYRPYRVALSNQEAVEILKKENIYSLECINLLKEIGEN